METKIFREGLKHQLLVVVSTSDPVLQHLVLFFEWLIEVFFMDESSWLVVEDVDPLEELDVLLYEVVCAGIQLVNFMLVLFEED